MLLICLVGLFVTFFSHFCAVFLPCLKDVSQQCCHLGCWAQLCPKGGLLEPAALIPHPRNCSCQHSLNAFVAFFAHIISSTVLKFYVF